MKYTEVADIITTHRTKVAIFSTYEFDPIYFERRLLASEALEQANRILIFMDGARYRELSRPEFRARRLNERYLVVPVQPPTGVFHPKLTLLIGEESDLILCGSNNLTQAGYTNNLELINAIDVPRNGLDPITNVLPAKVFQFFSECLRWSEKSAKRTAGEWLDQFKLSAPWLRTKDTRTATPGFIHSGMGPLWDTVISEIGDSKVKKVLIISPYFDKDLRLLNRVTKKWPQSPVEIVTQEQTGNLPANLLTRYSKSVGLYKIIIPNSRRLHAKLLAFVTPKETICFAGSANFTSAAFDGVNIETCLIVRTPGDISDDLFDGQLKRIKISPADFTSGKEEEPKASPLPTGEIELLSASLNTKNHLHIFFRLTHPDRINKLNIAFQKHEEDKPGRILDVPVDFQHEVLLTMDDAFVKGLHNAVKCFLIGICLDGSRLQSNAVYLIQESSLTYESHAGKATSDRDKIIRETGRGATEYLDMLAEREGYQAVIDFLQHFNIKYKSGFFSFQPKGAFRLIPHDPTLSDRIPNWVIAARAELEEAIFDFIDRHHANVLRKHTRTGNINGLSNFLDVFIECNKLLFLYYSRGKLNRYHTIDRITLGIGMFTTDYLDNGEVIMGYTSRMKEQLDNDNDQIKSAFIEALIPEHLYIGLFMAQIIRRGSARETDPTEYLESYRKKIEDVLSDLELRIDKNRLDRSLGFYSFLSDEEKNIWKQHINRGMNH
jgi:hypothetical protein